MTNVRPATVVEVLQEGYRYRVTWGGAWYEMFTQPGGTNPQVGDLVFPRVVHGAAELFLPAAPMAGIVYYSLPKDNEGGDRAQCELWKYDPTADAHTLLWTSSYSWTLGQAHISMLAWVPEVNLLYFAVNSVDWDVSIEELNELYKYDPSDGSVTFVTRAFGSISDAGYTYAMPLYDAAYFKGDLYLVQGGEDKGWGQLYPAVYKLTIPGEVLTKQYDHPTVDTSQNSPSIAVYGDDEELLFGCYHNIIPTGKVYSSLDGTSFSELASLGSNREILNMITDRSDGKVYIITGPRVLDANTKVYVYDGSSVSLELTINDPIDPYALAARYTGLVRNDLWVVGIDEAGDETYYKNGGSWNVEDIGGDFSYDYSLSGSRQCGASANGKLFLLGFGPSPTILIRQRVSGIWSNLLSVNTTNKWFSDYDTSFAMTLGGTAILPHEQ